MVTLERIDAGRVHLRQRGLDTAIGKPEAAAIRTATVGEPPLRPPSLGASWLALLANPIKRSIAWVWSRHRARRAVRELMALDDRLLGDIGLSRGQAVYAARYGHERGE